MFISDSDYLQILEYLSLLVHKFNVEYENIKISDFSFFDDYLENKEFLVSNISTLERFIYKISHLEVKK